MDFQSVGETSYATWLDIDPMTSFELYSLARFLNGCDAFVQANPSTDLTLKLGMID